MENKVLEIIKKLGLKTSFVINKSGLSKSAFYSIAKGDSVPSLHNARKISKVLNCPLDEVFPDDKCMLNRINS